MKIKNLYKLIKLKSKDNIQMNKSAEKLLTELYSNYQNIGEIVKHEKDPKLLK